MFRNEMEAALARADAAEKELNDLRARDDANQAKIEALQAEIEKLRSSAKHVKTSAKVQAEVPPGSEEADVGFLVPNERLPFLRLHGGLSRSSTDANRPFVPSRAYPAAFSDTRCLLRRPPDTPLMSVAELGLMTGVPAPAPAVDRAGGPAAREHSRPRRAASRAGRGRPRAAAPSAAGRAAR